MERHEIECSFIARDSPVVVRSLNQAEVFVQRNVKFRCDDLLWIESMVSAELFKDFACVLTETMHQFVE